MKAHRRRTQPRDRFPPHRERKERRLEAASEPLPEDEEWVRWGDQLVWADDFTSDYGYRQGAGWARARRLLQDVFAYPPGDKTKVEIGRVRYLGEGIWRRAYTADVSLSPDPGSLSGPYVVLLTKADAEPSFDDRVRFEARLLLRLPSLRLPLRTPRLLGLLPDAGRPAILESGVAGVPLDLRAGRQGGVRPWEVVAQVAAAVHSADLQPLAATETPAWRMPGYPTRREHALAELAVFEDLSEPVVQEAHTWALEHLPAAEPSVLIHGDLLGQNILLAPGHPTGLIDWEQARLGDPAYDLAIVTRGGRQPFKIDRGLDRLLESYAACAPEVRKEHVHLYELCLLTRWYRESLDPRLRSHPPEEMLDRLCRHFRRATGVRS